jgi:hypothetical protein
MVMYKSRQINAVCTHFRLFDLGLSHLSHLWVLGVSVCQLMLLLHDLNYVRTR